MSMLDIPMICLEEPIFFKKLVTEGTIGEIKNVKKYIEIYQERNPDIIHITKIIGFCGNGFELVIG